MKIAFFWTWEFSKNILDWVLQDSRVEVVLVVSQPDKPVWRKKILQKTHTKVLAEENNIEVLQPNKLLKNTEFLDNLDYLELDFILVVAYGKIVPMRVLNSAKYWCINLHWSKLPLYRGASPIQESIKNGDIITALTVMFMSKWMDEWDILKIQEVEIGPDDKTEDIFKKFEEFGSKLAIDTLEEVVSWKIEWIAQVEDEATYCSKINKQDWEVNFTTQSAEEIYNTFRAYSIWPGIYSFYNEIKLNIEDCYIKEHEIEYDEEFGVWDVVEFEQDGKKEIGILCKENAIVLTKVKLAWKKSMDILSFINGNREFLDYKF